LPNNNKTIIKGGNIRYKKVEIQSANKDFADSDKIEVISLKRLGTTPLKEDVIRIMLDHSYFDEDGESVLTKNIKMWLKDLNENGCVSGMISELVYYSDTLAFYDKHKDEINEILKVHMEDSGLSIGEMFGDKWDDTDPLALDTLNQNLLAWFGFEETAHNLGLEMGFNL